MKIKFFWHASEAFKDNILRPTAVAIDPAIGSKGALTCLLMDDGGIGQERSLPWLEEGLARVLAVKNRKVASFDWSREAWGAEISGENVKIFSLHDETYFDSLSLDAFEKVLKEWKSFTQTQPDANQSVEVVIPLS